MPRRSLKPQLNQIRAWVHQGRTDAWIAHQLEISATELREFRKQYDLSADDENAGSSEIDLRDEIEAEIEAAAAEEAAPRTRTPRTTSTRTRSPRARVPKPAATVRKRRSAAVAGAEAAAARKALEATFDHGEDDGYGLWLDASVKDNPVYTEHWAGKRDVTVRIEADQIVIRRAGAPAPSESDSDSDSDE